jgi:Lon protease-like protein
MGADPHASLPTEFPIFPLPGAVVLPGGRLPLNIFEPRYMALIEDSLGAGRMFGMIQPDTTRSETPAGPGLYRIGCLGRMTSFSETDDGRFLITLTGVTRFAVSVELEMRSGYRRVRADLARFAADLAPDGEGVEREKLLDALRLYFTSRGFDANWDAIGEMSDGMLVSTLAMACPFEPAEKQALLEAMSMRERSQALLTLLQIDAHSVDGGEQGRAPS